MKNISSEKTINEIVFENDRKNLAAVARALDKGRINSEAAEYLNLLYSGGMEWFREVFNVLGKCLGAPKAAVMAYDYATGCAIDAPIKISDINPMAAYMVHHRLDADPMRNQFFTADNNKIELSVSSIVSVIVGAQKNIERALEKITGKYYHDYVNNVADATRQVIAAGKNEASANAVADKIRERFAERFITNASETVLGIIGRGHEKIAVELVRELDKITKPHLRLNDVWRVKCLFDLIPQARIFIERIREVSPDKIMDVRDKFYDMNNPRNYRDAKLILNIGKNGTAIPMEIICQVRTFFEFEKKQHCDYEEFRKNKFRIPDSVEKQAGFLENGIKEYNQMICDCTGELFERVGWNILYSHKTGEELLFEGFPKISKQYYPAKVVDTIMKKLDSAVENEVFRVPDAPLRLSQAQEFTVFRWMAKFILVSAIPYGMANWKMSGADMSEKLFNFVMGELQRYYKK